MASIIGRGRPGGTIKKKAPEPEQSKAEKVKRDIFGGEEDDEAEAVKMFGLNTGGIGVGGKRQQTGSIAANIMKPTSGAIDTIAFNESKAEIMRPRRKGMTVVAKKKFDLSDSDEEDDFKPTKSLAANLQKPRADTTIKPKPAVLPPPPVKKLTMVKDVDEDSEEEEVKKVEAPLPPPVAPAAPANPMAALQKAHAAAAGGAKKNIF